jgi:hypothetical protein
VEHCATFFGRYFFRGLGGQRWLHALPLGVSGGRREGQADNQSAEVRAGRTTWLRHRSAVQGKFRWFIDSLAGRYAIARSDWRQNEPLLRVRLDLLQGLWVGRAEQNGFQFLSSRASVSLLTSEFSTKLFVIENSGGTALWAAPGDANGMNERTGMLPAG